MILLVGLGNPGDKYAKTRHNIGFIAVDEIANGAGFGPERSKFQGLIREGRIGTEKALILKPQTYMNESGRSVAEAARFYKVEAKDVIVFHDELDLAPGKLRMKRAGGHAGHNGLRSIAAQFSNETRRARIGIGHPGDKAKVSGYVLHEFAKADWDWIDPMCFAMARHAALLAADEDGKFQTAIAQDLNDARQLASPPKPKKAPRPAPEAEPKAEPRSPFDALRGLLKR